jgi:predicted ATP-grasp superfamily ATP-dependent carboligase
MSTILLSEGSSLSSRETITALGRAGHEIELLTSDTHCLGRFSKFVRAVHSAPTAGSDPSGYLAAVLDVIAKRKIDVLLPVHEQAYLFAAAREQIPAHVGLALASFQSFEQVQSKERFSALLSRLGVPQPQTDMRSLGDLGKIDQAYPFFVKTAFGTASEGVWRVQNLNEKRTLLAALDNRNTKRVVVQSEAGGKLERAQSVFDNGRIVAFHAYQQLARGPGGGDVLKISVSRPEVASYVEKIGAALAWHGALSFDYLLEDGSEQPLFIDANPRLVEPMNGLLSGVDLAGALVDVSLGRSPSRQAQSKAGVVTRLGTMGLMEAAGRRGRRRDVIREALLMAAGLGRYRGTVEELTPFRTDPKSAVPLTAVVVRLLFSTKSSVRMTGDTVRNYCLTSETIKRLQEWNAQAVALAAAEPVPV